MSTELMDPVKLYDDGPMQVRVGYSYEDAVQYYRDVQNQALEVAVQKVETLNEGLAMVRKDYASDHIRALKHRPKPEPQLSDMRATLKKLIDMKETLVKDSTCFTETLRHCLFLCENLDAGMGEPPP